MKTCVALRLMTAEMYHAYYREYQNDPDLYLDKNEYTPFVYSPEWVDQYIQRQRDRNRKCFAIMVGTEMAGEVILKNIEPGRCATLGICMKNDHYKNRGIGTQAERLAADYAFRELDVPVLYADSVLTNARSQHVLEKVGFRLLRVEGAFRYYRLDRTPEQTPVRWVFFDLGSTLIDETEADLHRIRDMIAGTGVTVEAYQNKRMEGIRQGLNGDQAAIAFFGLTKTPWHSEDERPYPDAASTLAVLKERGYRLGIIANQNPGTAERLSDWNLLHFFDVIAASAELGMEKPDPAIFLWALDQAHCTPERAVMAGDRLDNDVRPAKALGMRTIRIRRGIAESANPSCEAEVPDAAVDSLSEIIGVL